MKPLTRALVIVALGTWMALATPASAGGLSVSIVGDGYIVNPGPNAEVIYYGPQDYVAPPVVPYAGYGYGYGYPPPIAYGPPAYYGAYGPPPVYGYGGYGASGFGPGSWYGRRGLRLSR